MNKRLVIVKNGKDSQELAFEFLQNQDFAIYFRDHQQSQTATMVLEKKALENHPLLWTYLCKLADHLKSMRLNFLSEDELSPETSLLVTRFEEKITIDFFWIIKRSIPTPNWTVVICKKDADSRNQSRFPLGVDAEKFHNEFRYALNEIVNLGYKVEINS